MSCPCILADKPCNERCTCKHPIQSYGCDFCASYGSLEQRTEKSNLLTEKFRTLLKASLNTDNSQINELN